MVPSWPSAPPPPGTQAAAGYPASYQAAYTPVQVRQTFGQPYSQPAYPPSPYGLQAPPASTTYTQTMIAAPPAPAPESEPAKPKVNWPDSVRAYVQRSFMPSNLLPAVSRQEMEEKLKDVISSANERNRMYDTNWDVMPLPQEMIVEERKLARAVLATMPPVKPTHEQSSSSPSATSKKRKSTDMSEAETGSAPPWRSNTSRLEERVTFNADKRLATDETSPKALSKFQKQLEKRQKRFDGGYKSTYREPTPPPSSGPVVGTCQTLEKRYLRLTAPPVPSVVRPESVLHQTLELLKKKWKKEQNYSYICDQFKSMRQDLTVQRIKNQFTVEVYEIHARIALEKGDLGEYNQCQTQLKALYQLGIKGNPIEFKAYRILYFIHTANRTALNNVLADLTAAEKKAKAIKHALDVRSALALGNYHRFFQLYNETPNMGAYLMDMFVGRERLAALCNMCKAYKPEVTLRFITEELYFESDAEAAQFILDYDAQHLLEDKNGTVVFLSGKAGPFFEAPRKQAFSRVDIKGQI